MVKFPCILAKILGKNLVFRNISTLCGFGRVNLWRITFNILTKRFWPINTALMVDFYFRRISLALSGGEMGGEPGWEENRDAG